jgi:hypothetical protein
MTKKAFLNSLSGSKEDIIQKILDLLSKLNVDYCVIGGLAVNAYVDPVASLDFYIVIAVDKIDRLLETTAKEYKIKKFPHSINLTHPQSDLRIQLQTDKNYQLFIPKAVERDVLGYKMKVASLEDVLKGKIWAYKDEERRKSKRQKDLADIFRIVEAYPELIKLLPDELKNNF